MARLVMEGERLVLESSRNEGQERGRWLKQGKYIKKG